jgi:Zn-dependent protease/predicted transcriptional regulator
MPKRSSAKRSLKIGSVWGIEIRLDISVAIIFSLVVYSLGANVFPGWHEDWNALSIWVTALAAGALFFASLLAHELAHSIVALQKGIAVPRITLFVFGGISEMEREPDTPETEFLIAIAGPATSLLLGIVFTSLGMTLAGEPFSAQLRSEPESALAALGPVATLLLWLGPVNLVLAGFNLVPGFPLDGGRVLRAAVWWLTADLQLATRWATNAGCGVAWGLMAVGVVQLVQGAVLGGVWFILIGWFLYSAARSGQIQLLLRQSVERLKVSDLMRTRFELVPAELALDVFLRDWLMRSGQSAWPVTDRGQPVGIVSFEDVRQTREEERHGQTVADVMQTIDESVSPDLPGRDALGVLLRSEHDPLPVVEAGRIVGLLYRTDIMRWLALHQLEASAA